MLKLDTGEFGAKDLSEIHVNNGSNEGVIVDNTYLDNPTFLINDTNSNVLDDVKVAHIALESPGRNNTDDNQILIN